MSVKAKDTKIQFADAANLESATPSDWTSLATVVSIKPPPRSSKAIDATHLESDAMEREPGLPDVGDCEVVLHYAVAQSETVQTKFNEKCAWRILYPNGITGVRWLGWISEDGEEEVVQDDILRQAVKIAATGDITRFNLD